MGAWVETSVACKADGTVLSHLTWVRGLKQVSTHLYLICKKVAPYVGAWVETTGKQYIISKSKTSHLTWVRGLKQVMGTYYL